MNLGHIQLLLMYGSFKEASNNPKLNEVLVRRCTDARSRGIITEFECFAVTDMPLACGLVKRRNFQKYLRTLTTEAIQLDDVQPLLLQYAQAQAKPPKSGGAEVSSAASASGPSEALVPAAGSKKAPSVAVVAVPPAKKKRT
jgi:hypothetical protein